MKDVKREIIKSFELSTRRCLNEDTRAMYRMAVYEELLNVNVDWEQFFKVMTKKLKTYKIGPIDKMDFENMLWCFERDIKDMYFNGELNLRASENGDDQS